MGLFSLIHYDMNNIQRKDGIVLNIEEGKSDKWLLYYGVDGMYNILVIKIYPPNANLEHKVTQCIEYNSLYDLTLEMIVEFNHNNNSNNIGDEYKKTIKIYEDYKTDDYINYNIGIIQDIYPEEFI